MVEIAPKEIISAVAKFAADMANAVAVNKTYQRLPANMRKNLCPSFQIS